MRVGHDGMDMVDLPGKPDNNYQGAGGATTGAQACCLAAVPLAFTLLQTPSYFALWAWLTPALAPRADDTLTANQHSPSPIRPTPILLHVISVYTGAKSRRISPPV